MTPVRPCAEPRIVSAADDYRYPGRHRVSIHPCKVPAEIGDRCRVMAAAMGLNLAGIDLRRSGERGWYCFEVNPSPAFTSFELVMDVECRTVRGAIARLLASSGQIDVPRPQPLPAAT